MLTLDPGTMAGMTDEHLLSSLHGEHLTPCERELLKRWEVALDSKFDENEEALVKYPGEDFLSELQSQLLELSRSVRGSNKDKCLEILQCADNLAQQIDEWRSKLRGILNGR